MKRVYLALTVMSATPSPWPRVEDGWWQALDKALREVDGDKRYGDDLFALYELPSDEGLTPLLAEQRAAILSMSGGESQLLAQLWRQEDGMRWDDLWWAFDEMQGHPLADLPKGCEPTETIMREGSEGPFLTVRFDADGALFAGREVLEVCGKAAEILTPFDGGEVVSLWGVRTCHNLQNALTALLTLSEKDEGLAAKWSFGWAQELPERGFSYHDVTGTWSDARRFAGWSEALSEAWRKAPKETSALCALLQKEDEASMAEMALLLDALSLKEGLSAGWYEAMMDPQYRQWLKAACAEGRRKEMDDGGSGA